MDVAAACGGTISSIGHRRVRGRILFSRLSSICHDYFLSGVTSSNGCVRVCVCVCVCALFVYIYTGLYFGECAQLGPVDDLGLF